jgi:hypothetical protein
MERSREQLRQWAHEHLVYEAAMLAHSVEKVADSRLSNTDRNAFVESFAIHVRCLREFLWGERGEHPQDAFASDFCAPGVWANARPGLPAAIRAIEGKRNRIGREIVHLTYHRLDIEAETKDWDMGELRRVIADALSRFAEAAEPECLAQATRNKLALMSNFAQGPGVTEATHMIQPGQITGGTIPFPGYSADDV